LVLLPSHIPFLLDKDLNTSVRLLPLNDYETITIQDSPLKAYNALLSLPLQHSVFKVHLSLSPWKEFSLENNSKPFPQIINPKLEGVNDGGRVQPVKH